MKISGSYEFNASAQKVWEALTNPESLAGCIPGCEGMETVGEDEYRTVMTVGVGPVRGRYNAKITLADKAPFSAFRLVLEGNGPMGFANGEAVITLTEEAGRTTVAVESDAQIGGMVARVGQRLMDSVARMLLDRFFSCLQESIQ